MHNKLIHINIKHVNKKHIKHISIIYTIYLELIVYYTLFTIIATNQTYNKEHQSVKENYIFVELIN